MRKILLKAIAEEVAETINEEPNVDDCVARVGEDQGYGFIVTWEWSAERLGYAVQMSWSEDIWLDENGFHLGGGERWDGVNNQTILEAADTVRLKAFDNWLKG